METLIRTNFQMPKDTQGMVLLCLLAPLLRSDGVICITKGMPVCIIEKALQSSIWSSLDYPKLCVYWEHCFLILYLKQWDSLNLHESTSWVGWSFALELFWPNDAIAGIFILLLILSYICAVNSQFNCYIFHSWSWDIGIIFCEMITFSLNKILIFLAHLISFLFCQYASLPTWHYRGRAEAETRRDIVYKVRRRIHYLELHSVLFLLQIFSLGRDWVKESRK